MTERRPDFANLHSRQQRAPRRYLLALAVVFLLSGCKKAEAPAASDAAMDSGAGGSGSAPPPLVQTRRPLFKADREVGAPDFRSGLWLWSDPDCIFDARIPLKAWPGCARWTLIAQHRIVAEYDGPNGAEQRSFDYKLIAGTPRVLEWPADKAARYLVSYDIVVPTAQDEQGRITAVRRWPISCHLPLPGRADDADLTASPASDGKTGLPDTSASAAASSAPPLPPKPIPGMRLTKYGCTVRRPVQLLKAARLKAAGATREANFRWIRDGDH